MGEWARRLFRSFVAWPAIGIIVAALVVVAVRSIQEPDERTDGSCGFLATERQAADLRGCVLKTSTLRDVDLYGARFDGASLARADLRKRDLRDVIADGAAMADVRFDQARLDGISMVGADLRRASFRAACLQGADLRGADLRGADFTGADIADLDTSGAIGLVPGSSPRGWGSPVASPPPCSRSPR